MVLLIIDLVMMVNLWIFLVIQLSTRAFGQLYNEPHPNELRTLETGSDAARVITQYAIRDFEEKHPEPRHQGYSLERIVKFKEHRVDNLLDYWYIEYQMAQISRFEQRHRRFCQAMVDSYSIVVNSCDDPEGCYSGEKQFLNTMFEVVDRLLNAKRFQLDSLVEIKSFYEVIDPRYRKLLTYNARVSIAESNGTRRDYQASIQKHAESNQYKEPDPGSSKDSLVNADGSCLVHKNCRGQILKEEYFDLACQAIQKYNDESLVSGEMGYQMDKVKGFERVDKTCTGRKDCLDLKVDFEMSTRVDRSNRYNKKSCTATCEIWQRRFDTGTLTVSCQNRK